MIDTADSIRRLKENSGKPKDKARYVIPKKSAKKIAKEIEEKKQRLPDEDTAMEGFFKAMRKKMKGRCLFCGGQTEKQNDKTFRNSIAHLLPKNNNAFPSVATNSENWIELCFYGNSCHTNFDQGTISWEFIKDSKEWDIIKEKLFIVLPEVAEEERKHKLYSHLEKLLYKND